MSFLGIKAQAQFLPSSFEAADAHVHASMSMHAHGRK
jgi:hypothetical protein